MVFVEMNEEHKHLATIRRQRLMMHWSINEEEAVIHIYVYVYTYTYIRRVVHKTPDLKW